MDRVNQQSDNGSPVAAMRFDARHPSQQWERLPAHDNPQEFLWVWFKPQGMPNSLTVRIPDETRQSEPPVTSWTMRRLLLTTGVDPVTVGMWQLYGATYDGMQGTSPLLDQPVPAPPPGIDPSIFIYVNVPVPPQMPLQQGAPFQQPAQPVQENASGSSDVYERIDTDWNAILEIETQVKALRKNIIDMQGRLKALNRDLNTDERTHADSMDTKDWLEARRALRDANLRLSVCLKEVDMGDFSAAGQRSWFENIFEQFVVPRKPFDNMPQVQTNFAYHRKMVTTLQTTMSGALTHARNGAERRAQQVLNRIAAKVRDAQTRKNFLGAMFDSH